jgi:hypothetical protein
MVFDNRLGAWLLVIAIAVTAVGCGSSSSSSSSGGGSSMDQMAAQLDEQAAARKQDEARIAAEKKAQEEAAAKTAADAPPERKVAGRAGVGEGGYYTAIVGARRHVLNRVDDLAWTQGVQHFQATEGRLPKDHKEFMSKVVEPLGIDLGFKEENQEFLYDPSQGQWGEVYVVEKLAEPAPQ